MKGGSDRRFRRFNKGKVRSLAISALFCYLSMDRQTESFVCLGLIVILLQNTGRSQAECSKKFTDLSGQILDTLHKETRDTSTNTNRGSSHACRYRVCAPPDHYIILNITRLEGTPLATAGHACLPRAVVKSGGPLGRAGNPLATLCQGERPLPLVVHSQGNELRIVFRSQSWQTSTFQASFSFHKRIGPSSCIACPLVQKLNESMNASFTLQPQNDSQNSHLEVPNGATEDSTSSGAWHMEYFVLVVLAPLTVVCLCCVIMYYLHRRSNNRLTSHSSSLPTSSFSITSDNPPVPVNQSPLIPRDRFSSQHQQDRLRKQREMVCSHSESTEKFPTSVCLPDEDEPQHMRDNIRIHREVMSENGIRAPPNRTVYDSERQDLMIQVRSKTENLQRHSVRRTPSNVSQSKRGVGGGVRGVAGAGFKHGATTTPTPAARTAASLQGLSAIDSETRSPLNLVDSDSEGPPPYASLVQTKNNIINVCDDSTVSMCSGTGGLLQSQPRPCTPPSCQPNSNGRFHASARGANRGSSVRLKNEGPDKV